MMMMMMIPRRVTIGFNHTKAFCHVYCAYHFEEEGELLPWR